MLGRIGAATHVDGKSKYNLVKNLSLTEIVILRQDGDLAASRVGLYESRGYASDRTASSAGCWRWT